MKRVPLALVGILVLVVVVLAVGLIVAPQPTRQAWSGLGLPLAVLERAATVLPGAAAAPNPSVGPITASGTIEAVQTAVAAEVGGRAVEVLVDEGAAVEAGQLLVRLDDSQIRAQLQEAEKAVETAKANLALAQAGPRPAQVAIAEAKLGQARATLAAAQQALADAQRARANLLELDAQINSAQARVALAGRQIEQARARQAAVAALRQSIAGDGSDQGKTQRAVYEKQEAAAAEAIAAAQEELRTAQRVLSLLRQMRDNPVALDAQVNAAQGQVRLAEQGVRVAEAAAALAAAGPRPEAVALAEAQLAKAEAGRALLLTQAERYAVTSPVAGQVLARSVNPGETVQPGVPLLQVAGLDQVTLVVYVPTARIGQVSVGQPAAVVVDAYPGRTFPGTVTYISPRAEFTPKNIQTPEERVETVFAVKITLDNADRALKPGMPADATIPAP